MRFPGKFTRYIGASSPDPTVTVLLPAALVAPMGKPKPNTDTQVSTRPYNFQGWPGHRVALAYTYIGVGPAPLIDTDVYFWEDSTEAWYRLNGSTPIVLTTGEMNWSDLASIVEKATVNADPNNSVGSIDLAIVVACAVPPDGLFKFAFGVDLTSS